MHRDARRLGLAAGALAMALSLESSRLSAQLPQPITGKDPLIGIWKLNLEKSKYERGGPGKPAPAANPRLVWTYNAERNGIRMSVYAMGLEQAATRSYVLNWDGKEYMDPQGPGRHESVIFWRMDPKMLTRLVLEYKTDEDRAAHRNPVRQEWVSWCVSEDNKTLAINAWDPKTPEYTNRQIFDRVSDQPPSATK